MKDKDYKRHVAYEVLVFLGLLAIFLYMTRLWPILLLVILGIFIAAIRLLFLTNRHSPHCFGVPVVLKTQMSAKPGLVTILTLNSTGSFVSVSR